MLFKISGFIFLLLGSLFISSTYIEKKKNAVNIAEQLYICINLLKSEIVYFNNQLSVSFDNVAKKAHPCVKSFFEDISKEIECEFIKGSEQNIWKCILNRYKKPYMLDEALYNSLLTMSAILGQSDENGVIECIDITLNMMERENERIKDDFYKKRKLILSLGALFGITIAIILS